MVRAIVATFAVLHCGACGGGSGAPEVARTLDPGPAATPSPAPGGVATPVITPTPVPRVAGEDGMLVVARLYGTESATGRRTVKDVALRYDADGLGTIDYGRDTVVPYPRWPVPAEPPAGTLWGIASARDGAAAVVRSEDAGDTWEAVATLDPGYVINRVFGVDVALDSDGVPTAWIAIAEGEAFAPGPVVWTARLDGTPQWSRVPDIPIVNWIELRGAHLARRGGALELLRSASLDPPLALYGIAGSRFVEPIPVDAPIDVVDYATAGDCGWIAATTRPDADAGSRRAAVVAACGAESWSLHEVAGPETAATALDFLDAWRGFLCGERDSREPFCFATDDGGASWSEGDVEPGGAGSIRDVLRTSADAGWATRWTWPYPAELLRTGDGGRSWQRFALPPLATMLELGPLMRLSGAIAASAPGSAELARAVSPREPATAALTPRAAERSAAGTPALWLVGDSAERGAYIAGLALRSDDGGLTWSEALAIPGGSLSGVDFADAASGWIAGGGRIFHTRDGGESFVEQTASVDLAGRLLDVGGVSAADRDAAIATAMVLRPDGIASGALLSTTSGGETWSTATGAIEAALGPFVTVDGACLTRGGFGIAVVSPRVFLTRDRGATWQPGPAFAFERSGEGWSIRGEGFAGPRLECSGDADLWIAVSGGDARAETLWHSPDGGSTWEDLSDAVGEIPQGRSLAAFAESGIGWLSLDLGDGRPPRLRSTTDRGRSWSVVAMPLRSHSGDRSADYVDALALGASGSGIAAATALLGGRFDAEHSFFVTSDAGTRWRRTHPPADFHPIEAAVAE